MKLLALTLGLLATVQSRSVPKTQKNTTSAIVHTPRPGYTPTFIEDFSGTTGSLPSKSNWIFDIGTQYPGGGAKWGNEESETYTKDTSNIHITSTKTLAIIPRLKKGTWTSARIETKRNDFAAQVGGKLYVEVKIKLGDAPASSQQGIWPAFWALGSRFRGSYTNWPQISEWDFMEVVNGLPTMYSTAHCGTAPDGPCNEFDGLGNGGVPYKNGEWHTVGFEVDRSMCGHGGPGCWKDETLAWFLDNTSVFVLRGARVGDEDAWKALAHDPHFLLLNVAVGGNWPQAPNSKTIDGPSVGMEVDYVGVWNSV